MTRLKTIDPNPKSRSLPAENTARTVLTLKKDTSLTLPQALVAHLLYRGRWTLMSAREKVGKTTLMWWLASKLAGGGTVFDKPVDACRVLIVSLEEALGDSKSRAIALGGKAIDGVFVLSDLNHPAMSRLQVLQANIDVVRPDVVLIDSMTAYAAGDVADENSTSAWRVVLPALQRIAHGQGIALLMLHHAKKTGGEARGATVITSTPDVLVDLAAVEGDGSPLRKLAWKGRYGAGSMKITFDADSQRFSLASESGGVPATAAPAQRAGAPTTADIEARVLAVVRERKTPGGIAAGQVRTLAGGKAERVDRALEALLARGAVVNERDGRTSRYSLAG